MARRSTWIVTGVLGAAGIAAGMSMALADEPTTIDLDAVDAPSTADASSPAPGPTSTPDPRAVDPASPAPGSSVTAQSADTPAPTPELAPAQTQVPARAPTQAPAQTSGPASGTSGGADAPVVVSPASPVSADTPDDEGSDDADDDD